MDDVEQAAAGSENDEEVIDVNENEEDGLHSVGQIELSLENITYAPVVRSGRGVKSSGGSGGFCSCLKSQSSGGNSEIKSRKVVLQDVSAKVSPYMLSAWMGPSGSGKTSLVSVAAGYCPKSDLIDESTVRSNGNRGRPPAHMVSVVHQDDLMLPNLTVAETIAFAARLKNSDVDVSNEAVARLVDETITELGLSSCRDSLVGGVSTRGISGGERKRLAVAVELVGRPSILLMDEPTSNLDSTAAYALMTTLKELARAGHSIAVVVHQPRTEIFNLFDDLLLLSRGRAVYSGRPDGVQNYLESVPTVAPLPKMTGIADWVMDSISLDEKRDGGAGSVLANYWRDENDKAHSKAMTNMHRSRSMRLSTLAELHAEPKFKTRFSTQLKLLVKRSWIQQRGERLTRVACIFTSAYVIFTSILYFRLPDTTDYVFPRTSLLFFMIITQGNGIVTSSVGSFSRERALLNRERAKKLYGVFPYFLAKTLSDLTMTTLLPLVYGIILYWIANLRATAAAFFAFVLIFYLTVSTAQATGLLLSVAIPNLQAALMLAPTLMIFIVILAGFYVPLDNLNPAIEWASWASFARYGYSALIINEFSGRDIECGSDAIDNEGDACPLSGDDVVSSIGLSGAFTNLWLNVIIVVLIQLFIRALTYWLLRRSR